MSHLHVMLCWRYKICSCLTGGVLSWWAWTPVGRLARVARQQRWGRGVFKLFPRFPPAPAIASSVFFLLVALFICTLGFGKPAAGRLCPPEEWYLGVSDTLYLVNFVSYLWPTFVAYIWPTLSPICGQPAEEENQWDESGEYEETYRQDQNQLSGQTNN